MADKTARPTAAERKIVDRRLQKKYGHKYKVSEDWVPKLKKKVKATLRKEKKKFETARTKSITAQLREAGLTDKEINRLRGKK